MSLPTTPQSWANRLMKILSAHQAVHGLPRFPIDVAALAQDFSRQVFPEAPITIVKGLALGGGSTLVKVTSDGINWRCS